MATRVERGGIEECVKKINSAIEQLTSAATEINSSMDELPNYWEGAAYDNARIYLWGRVQTLLTTTVPEAVGNFRDYIISVWKRLLKRRAISRN